MHLIFKVAVVLFVGFIGGKIAKRFKLPEVSGYLVLGLILGPSLGLIFTGYQGFISDGDQNALKFVSEIALAFIAFSIGSEFSVTQMKKIGKKINTITMYEVLFAVLAVFLILFFIPKPEPIMVGYNPFSKGNISFGLILASMSAATAPAATLMVMRQYRAYGPVTKTVLPVTALDDIYGIVVFGFFISIAQMLVSTTSMPVWLMITKPFIEVFGSIIIGMIIGYVLSKVSSRFEKIRDDLQVISMIAILFGIGVTVLLNNYFVKYNLGVSSLLVNIMIGTMVANMVKKPANTFNSVNDFTTPFYVLFFTLAGASLDLGIIKTSALISIIAVSYIFARGIGKFSGAYVGSAVSKADPMVKKYLGFALLPQGGVSLGLLVIVSRQMPSFYPLISTIIMLSILIYETTGPIFAKHAISKAGEINGLDRLDQISSIEGVSLEGV
ncbi:MAG: cation:proton antiporter [Acholeplasmataceae bacterium]